MNKSAFDFKDSGDTLSIFRTVRHFERVSPFPPSVSPSFALSRAFPASPSMRQSRAKSPRQGPTWGRRGAEVDLAGVIPNISVWYAVWYITFSTEPNVVLNSIHARKNSPIPEDSVQNDRSCQIVPNKTRPCQTESVKSPLQSGWVRYGCSPVLSVSITIYLLFEAENYGDCTRKSW